LSITTGKAKVENLAEIPERSMIPTIRALKEGKRSGEEVY
jgi:hypothetical protein